MRLTDTREEQELLEAILEESKPPVPLECEGLDYLLFTPFRYDAPYPRGSRFRRAGQKEGVFYGAETVETAIAETSFYKFLFFVIEAPGMRLPASPLEHTAFAVGCETPHCLALCAPPLDQDDHLWRHPTDYAECQKLADMARTADIQVLRYHSVRDPGHGINCALLSAEAFAEQRPKNQQTWHIYPRSRSVRARCENPPISLEFRREDFASDPRLTA